MLAMLAIATLGVTLFIWYDGVYASFWTSLRHVVLQPDRARDRPAAS